MAEVAIMFTHQILPKYFQFSPPQRVENVRLALLTVVGCQMMKKPRLISLKSCWTFYQESSPKYSHHNHPIIVNIICSKLHRTMCFLKNIASIDKLPTRYEGVVSPRKEDSDTDVFHEEQNLIGKKTHLLPLFCKPTVDHQEMMLNCMRVLSYSSQIITHLDQKIEQSCTAIDESYQWLQQNTPPQEEDAAQTPPPAQQSPLFKTQNSTDTMQLNSLQTRLFGVKDHQYRLELEGDFPETLYKDRNFGLKVRLIDKEDGKESRNSNMINLCLGVASETGQWVTVTRDGVPFMKGRLEAELYHGEASFVKLAPRDVSRSLPGRVINLVVYAKPSILKYAGQSTLEESIDPELVEPLIIKAVHVMAKRRE